MRRNQKILLDNIGNCISPDKYSLGYTRALVRYVKNGLFKSFFRSKFKKNPSYRRLYKAENYKELYKFTLFNSMWDLFLQGLAELTGITFKPETYELLTILRKLSIYIDDALDLHRIGDIENKDLSSIDMKLALKDKRVAENLDALKAFLMNQDGDYSDKIMNYLTKIFSKYQDDYTDILKKSTIPFEDCLYLTEQDSGLWLIAVSECLTLFHDHNLTEDEKDVLFNLGVACKFADDLNDICRDYKTNAPNLMISFMNGNSRDFEAFLNLIHNKKEISKKWWLSHLPEEYRAYFREADKYYKMITAQKFQLLTDLSFLPSIVGKDYDKKR